MSVFYSRTVHQILENYKSPIIIINQSRQMRIESPDLGWHGLKDRILSIDFHPFSNEFATAGSDDRKLQDEQSEGTQGCIKIWELLNDGKPFKADNKNIRILYGLSEADKNTNVVKFSPNGAYMASGSDDKCIIIWQKRQNNLSINRVERIFRWSIKSKLMGHAEDVLDLRWTNSSKYLVSAGMDKRIFIWNVQKKYHVKVLDQHEKFVQGIAVDPRFQHIISCSNDRTTKVWKAVKTKKSETEFYCKKSLKRFEFQRQEEEDDHKGGFRIFADESVPTFFRRPDISPDGEIFAIPAGIWQKDAESGPEYCAFLYRKNFLDKPSFFIPMKGQPALICKFCPKLFKKTDQNTGLFQQPYYMVFAVATSSTLLVYSTMSLSPLYAMGNYHYAALTDISWRSSTMLAVSSSDGYCSFMIWNDGELGQEFIPEGQLAEIMKIENQGKQMLEKPTQNNQNPEKQEVEKVQYRQTQNGVKKKRIIPKKIGDI